MIINGQVFSPGTILSIKDFITASPSGSRADVARFVCKHLSWTNEKGAPKLSSCKQALLKLHKKGIIKLPEPKRKASATWIQKKEVDFVPSPVTGDLRNVPNLTLDLVSTREDNDLWHHIIQSYHYLGKYRIIGPQIKYLIRSDGETILGALCFSSAAWSIKRRDEFIGWNEGERKRGLKHIVNNTRFLILPTVQVKNLASKVLGMAVRRLPEEWESVVGVQPYLLETFVEEGLYAGTCYQASNWIDLGLTSGRGRNDQLSGNGSESKRIFVYPLRKDLSGLVKKVAMSPTLSEESSHRPIQALVQGPVFQGKDWAENEFGTVDLGDPRNNIRLQGIARDFGNHPGASIQEACEGCATKTRGASRFFNNPNVTLDKILQPHYEASLRRCSQESVVLASQDTTSLNYVSHPATANLGPIASKKTGAVGLMVHDTLLVNPEGTPLGLLDVQCWARKEDEGEKKSTEVESDKWFHSYEKTCEAQRLLPGTHFISVGDREADIYDLFVKALKEEDQPDLIIRAKNDRRVQGENDRLWDEVTEEDSIGEWEVRVSRKKGEHVARTAKVEVRVRNVQLLPPGYVRKSETGLNVWAVHVVEKDPPKGVEGIEWMLLTTCAVKTKSAAEKIVGYYGLRWQIEVYHRTIKTGLKIEDRRLPARHNLENCLAVDMVVAWRVFYLVMLGRETPDVPCEVFFLRYEWQALIARVDRIDPCNEPMPTLGEAVRMLGGLGGFLGRKSDGEPGPQAIWTGLEKLYDSAEVYKVMARVTEALNTELNLLRVQYGT